MIATRKNWMGLWQEFITERDGYNNWISRDQGEGIILILIIDWELERFQSLKCCSEDLRAKYDCKSN
jgi:hypothetical protein